MEHMREPDFWIVVDHESDLILQDRNLMISTKRKRLPLEQPLCLIKLKKLEFKTQLSHKRSSQLTELRSVVTKNSITAAES